MSEQAALAHALHVVRTERGLSLRAAADEIGCAASTLLRAEKRTGTPHFRDLTLMLRWLGCPLRITIPPAFQKSRRKP